MALDRTLSERLCGSWSHIEWAAPWLLIAHWASSSVALDRTLSERLCGSWSHIERAAPWGCILGLIKHSSKHPLSTLDSKWRRKQPEGKRIIKKKAKIPTKALSNYVVFAYILLFVFRIWPLAWQQVPTPSLSLSFPQLFVVRNNLLLGTILQNFNQLQNPTTVITNVWQRYPCIGRVLTSMDRLLRCNYTVLWCHELILVSYCHTICNTLKPCLS